VIRKCCPLGQIYDLSEYARGKIFCVPDSLGGENDSATRLLEESVVLFEDENNYNNNNNNGSKTIQAGSVIHFVPNGKGWCKSYDQRRKVYSPRKLLPENPYFL